MKLYFLLIGFPLYLRWFYRAVKFLFPLIKFGANSWLAKHTKQVSKHALNKPLSQGGIYMTELYGIKETQEVIGVVLDVALATVSAFTDDGKFTTADLTKYLPAIMEIPEAIAGCTMLPAELKDFHEGEMEELKAFVIEKAKAIPGIELKWLKVASGCLTIARGGLEIADAFRV